MAGLADFLGGDQSSPVQAAGTSDPGFEERKAGWKQALEQMVADPVNAMTMFTIGQSLQNIQPGENVGAQVTRAIGEGLGYRAQYQKMLDEHRLAKEEAQRQARKDSLEERKVAGQEANLKALAQDRAENRRLQGERLGLDRERLGVERQRAQTEAQRVAKGEGAKGSSQISAPERLAAQFMADDPSLTRQAAVKMASASLKATDPEEAVGKMALEITKAKETALQKWALLEAGDPPIVPTADEARAQARRLLGLQEPTPQMPRVTSKAQAMALPSGTEYIFIAADGTEYKGRKD